jgi:hypothetical protein
MIAGLVIATVVVATSSEDAHGQHPPRALCERFSCRTLARDRTVLVYQLGNRHPDHELLVQRSYARFLPTGRQTALGDSVEGATLRRSAVAGRYVAYALSATFDVPRGTIWEIGRLKASSGRREIVSAEPGEEGRRSLPKPAITVLALAPTGAVAWIIAGPDSEKGDYRVFGLPAGARRATLLAKGSDVAPKSLEVSGNRFYWIQAGTTHASPTA